LPGLGLLLLRAALGITALAEGAIVLSGQSNTSFWTLFAGMAAIAGGVLILLGFLTPVVGALLLAGGLTAAAFWFSASAQALASPVVYEIILSAAVVLLGPGAFSLDARLFGRREIIIPKN
jgi:uncharacterized membrane protein YphA (DoxX/SURF4 family)